MTKANILECLNEIGYRFARCGDETKDLRHYKELGIAFGVAWLCVSHLSEPDAQRIADTIERLGLGQGSVQ